MADAADAPVTLPKDAPGSAEKPIVVKEEEEQEPYPSVRKRKKVVTIATEASPYPDPFSDRFNEMRRLDNELIIFRRLLCEKADGLDPRHTNWIIANHLSDLLACIHMLPSSVEDINPLLGVARNFALSFHTHIEKLLEKEAFPMVTSEQPKPKEAPVPEIMVTGESLREFAVTIAKKE